MAAIKNFSYSTVAVAPSPATSGTSLTVSSGEGALFAIGQPAVIYPTAVPPLASNAEIVTVTNVAGDVLTITRAQESTSARTVVVGDQIAQVLTAAKANLFASELFTAKGDIAAATAANTPARLAVGTNGQVLTADSAETTGMKWATPSAGGSVATDAIWDAAGDLVQGTGANAAARLAIGTAGQVLTVNAGATAAEWKTLAGTGDVTAAANLTDQAIVVGSGGAKGVASSTLSGIPLLTSGVPSASNVTNHAQTQAAIVPNTAPAAGEILVGNAGGTAYAKAAVSGDATLASTGALTIAAAAVSLAKMADLAASKIIARKTQSTGAPEACSLSEVLDLVGSAASGDILYRGASTWTRLAKGSDSQVLTLASGLPAWSAASGGFDIMDFTKMELYEPCVGLFAGSAYTWRSMTANGGSNQASVINDTYGTLLRSNSTSGGFTSLSLASGGSSGAVLPFLGSYVWEMKWWFRFGSSISNIWASMGVATNQPTGSADCSDGLFLRYKQGTDTNFRLVAANASSYTLGSDNLGAPATATWYLARMWCTGDGVIHMTLNGGTESTVSTGLPTVRCTPWFQVGNNSAVDQQLYLGKMAVRIAGLAVS